MTGLGKAYREGITFIDIMRLFPDEATATKWFETNFWPDGHRCPHCNSTDTYETNGNTIPYRCRKFRKRFSVRTGMLLQSSRLPLFKWV